MVSKKRSNDGVPSVSVLFPDGYKDTLILSKFHANDEDRIANEEHCNYAGHLLNEPEACVAMTGCFGSEDVHSQSCLLTLKSHQCSNGQRMEMLKLLTVLSR